MVRAGSRVLSIFTNALNARVLHAHRGGPLRSSELDEALAWAPQSSLRAVVTKMCELGALARASSSDATATELTTAGWELLLVADVLEHWLRIAPDEPIPLEDPAAHGIIRVLTAGWDSSIVRALAERPQTLLELSEEISGANYPTLKRRLAKLRSTRLAVPASTGSASAYAASDWLRRAIVPLILAGRWERKHESGGQPVSPVEVEAAFLLSLPLVDLPARASGSCALAVMTSSERTRSRRRVAGVTVKVKQGALVSCETGAALAQDTWALGSVDAWFDAVVDGSRDALRFSGAKPHLAQSLVKALHAALFRSSRAASTIEAAGGQAGS